MDQNQEVMEEAPKKTRKVSDLRLAMKAVAKERKTRAKFEAENQRHFERSQEIEAEFQANAAERENLSDRAKSDFAKLIEEDPPTVEGSDTEE